MLSGIGFAIGLERLSMGIEDDDERFARSIDIYVATVGESARETAFILVNSLRAAGIAVEARYSSTSLKGQMKVADRVGARKVIMIGDDELSRQEVTVRDMQTREQTSVRIDTIVSYLQGDKS